MKKLWILCLSLLVLLSLVGCSKKPEVVEKDPAPTTQEEAIEQAQSSASQTATAYKEYTSVADLKKDLQDIEIIAKDELTVLPLIETDSEFVLQATYAVRFNDNSVVDVYYFPKEPGEEFYVVTLRESISGTLNSSQSEQDFSGDFNNYSVNSQLRLMEEGVVVDLYGTDDGIYLADWINSNLRKRYCLTFSTPVPAAVVESIVKALYA